MRTMKLLVVAGVVGLGLAACAHQGVVSPKTKTPAATLQQRPKPATMAPKATVSSPGRSRPAVASAKTDAKSANKAAPERPVSRPDLLKDKEKRLADLLEQYRADKITPHEYHQQRAKILAEP